MSPWIALATFLLSGLLYAPAHCAQPAAARPAFEVTSVKLNKGCDSRAGGGRSSPDRWSMRCRPLRWYIETAYGAFDGPRQRWPRPQVLGGPRWVDSEMYDISAKAERASPHWQMSSLMLQTLLEERFHVRVHTEARPASVYVLTVTRDDSRLKHSSCAPTNLSNSPSLPSPAQEGPQRGRAMFEPGRIICGGARFMPDGPNVVADWYGISMSDFAGYGIPARVSRPVIDRTGLTGLFDIHLEYSSDDALTTGTGHDAPTAPAIVPKPSIPRALQEQLGLKLTPDRAPLEVIVIDHVEKPSEN